MKRTEVLFQESKSGQHGIYPYYTKVVAFGDVVPEAPGDSWVTDKNVEPDTTYYRLNKESLAEASDEYFDLESRIKKHREELDALVTAQREIKSAIDSLVYEHGDLSVDGVVFAYVDESVIVLKPRKI